MMKRIAGFQWDDGNWPKCAKHGVSMQEIEHVLTSRPFVLPDRTGGAAETRYNAVGQNAEGRYLFIVYTLRQQGEDTLLRPISARYMHDKEIRNYERQKRT